MEVFDSITSEYDNWYKTTMGAFVDKVETALAFGMFKAPKGSNVLDIGCGTGNFSIKLAEMGYRVTGIDISDTMLDIAQSKTITSGFDIKYHNMDVYKLNFADESFDAVFSMAAFEFLDKPEKALDEMFRIAVKGAQILVGTINGDSDWGRLYMSDQYRKNTVFRHTSFMTPEKLKSLRHSPPLIFGQCLFIDPWSQIFNIETDREMELAGRSGGFICALWEK